MNFAFTRSSRFWVVFLTSALFLSLFFAWELNIIHASFLPVLPRSEPSNFEKFFTGLLILFLAFDSGLLAWRMKYGHCPVGAKRATFFSGALGFVALLCPVCLILPFGLFGLTLSITFLLPYLPLLRSIVVVLLVVTTAILLPRKETNKKRVK